MPVFDRISTSGFIICKSDVQYWITELQSWTQQYIYLFAKFIYVACRNLKRPDVSYVHCTALQYHTVGKLSDATVVILCHIIMMVIPIEQINNIYTETISLESNFRVLDENVKEMLEMISQMWWIIVSQIFKTRFNTYVLCFASIFLSRLSCSLWLF